MSLLKVTRSTIFLHNIGCTSDVSMHSFRRWSSMSQLITNRLSPFWKRIVSMKHCSTMYSRLAINFLNHFKCFCHIKTGFPAKTNHCPLFICLFQYDLWYGQNRQVTSCRKYVSHCEQFELKLGMCGKEGLLTNFLKFHGDRTTSTMFSQRCRKTYQTDLVCLRNCWSLKLEMSVVKMCENMFSLSKVKMKFSIEQKVFIVRVYYITKSY